MQRLICMLCLSVKSNTLTLRMQLEIKCWDLSVLSANQWKATHPPWGCNLRSNAETYLYALPISKKQHIHPEDATRDQMQQLICTLCQSVKSNTSTLRMQLKIKCSDLSVCSANQKKATHPTWGCNSRYVCSANQWITTHPPRGCNSRSNAEIYLYAKPISEKQYINPENASGDQMQRFTYLYALPISE